MDKYCSICGNLLIHDGTKCRTCVAKIRRYKMKEKAVNHLGGKCVRCGYDQHLAALEFHHTGSEKKDFTIGMNMNRKWDYIKDELKKCILLCSNCHRIEHSKYTDTSSLVM